MKHATEEYERALAMLCGLHPCMTIDCPPEEVAQRIFDSAMSERRELLEQIASQERALEGMRRELARRRDVRS